MDFQFALDKLSDADVGIDPFPHLAVDRFFTDEDYAEILDQIPRDEEWYNFPDPKSRRRRWQTQTYTFDFRSNDLLRQVSELFESDDVLEILREKFEYTTRHELGASKVVWCRDYDAFSISPHIDQEEKIFSFLFYLARDDENPQNGTQLLRAHVQNGAADRDHQQWYNFEKVRDIDFLPNRFVCWNVNARSYHSVDVRFRHDDEHPYRDTIRGFHFSDASRLPYLFQDS